MKKKQEKEQQNRKKRKKWQDGQTSVFQKVQERACTID